MNPSVPSLTIDVVSEVVQEDGRNRASAVPDHLPAREFAQSSVVSSNFNRRTGALVSVAIAAIAGSSLVQVDTPPVQYEGKLQLLIEPGAKDGANQSAKTNTAGIATPSIDYDTQIRVLWSPKLLDPVVKQLQKQYPELNYDRLSQRLNISHSEGSRTLEIRYRDSDPQKTQVVLEQISRAYIQYSQECRTSTCRERQFVERQLRSLQQQVMQSQKNLQVFQQQTGLTDPNQLGQQLSARRNGLAQQQQDLGVQLTEVRTRYALLQKQLNPQVSEAAANQLLTQNLRYQQLFSQLRETTEQFATELGQPQPNHSILQSLSQRHKQLSVQAAQAVQQPLADRLAQATANPAAVDYRQVAQLETLREWVMTANQLQVLEINRQAIAEAEALLDRQINQWAVLARHHDELHLELTLATNRLDQYRTKQAELQTITQPTTAWKATASPQVEQATEDVTLVSPHLALSVSLACFALVVWVLTTQRNRSRAAIFSPQELQPVHAEQALLPTTPIPGSQPVWSSSQSRCLQLGVAVLLLKAAMYTDAVRVAPSYLHGDA